MFERLKSLYLEGRLNDDGLQSAVQKGWITQEQAVEIRKAKTDGESPSGSGT